MDRGAWRATYCPGVTEELDTTERLTLAMTRQPTEGPSAT